MRTTRCTLATTITAAVLAGLPVGKAMAQHAAPTREASTFPGLGNELTEYGAQGRGFRVQSRD